MDGPWPTWRMRNREHVRTVYDISSILILWFAGASAMAGLINIVPRYLPSYGMAPEWSRAVRPVVLVYTGVSILITIGFDADVNAQAGAYATGILVMMASGAVAVTISAVRRRPAPAGRLRHADAVLLYALAANVIAKPDGHRDLGVLHRGDHRDLHGLPRRADNGAACGSIELDDAARRFIADPLAFDGALNLIANRRQGRRLGIRREGSRPARHEPGSGRPPTSSSWKSRSSILRASATLLHVRGVDVDGYRVLRARSPAAPNAIAAILLALRDATRLRPHAYFEWSEGNPLGHLLLATSCSGRATPPRSCARSCGRASGSGRRPGIHVGGG